MKSGDLSRAANLYRAAQAGPLSGTAKADVERELSARLQRLPQAAIDSVTSIPLTIKIRIQRC